MKKLFLLPVIALVAIISASLVSAGCAGNDGNCACPYSCECRPGTNCEYYDCVYDPCSPGCDSSHYCCHGACQDKQSCSGAAVFNEFVAECQLPGTPIPEFTSLGAGIALIGASAGYALIRKKK